MRLLHRTDPRAHFSGAVAPHTAQELVGQALRNERHRLKGLDQLGYYGQFPRDADIVDAVRSGEWLLLQDEPVLVSSGGFKQPRPEPEERPIYIKEDYWPLPKPREDLVFAKSCEIRNWGRTCAGSKVESAEHFGSAMLCGAVAIPASATTAINAGAETALARIAGGGILQRGYTWALRGLGAASSPASLFILGMLPARLNDDTFYNEDRLRTLDRARTRVRFQIRRDAEGALQVYGIHTGPDGDDHVRTVKAKWVGNDWVMEAHLNGLTILWTPNKGEGPIPPLIYPEHRGKQLDNILVHPIAPDTDSQIEIYPGSEDITTDDFILTFPANSGMRAMYVVYAVSPRDEPGVVTGEGVEISGIWLADAGVGQGAPIPSQVANKLRGKSYRRFDDFRKDFWKAVSEVQELNGQLALINQRLIRSGNAPFVAGSEAVGRRKKFELHHVRRVVDGGEVYDVENLRVSTPRNHIFIHASGEGE
ncbi:S-type pyocin domain-containing protein [Pseudomonas knackmussii]|uniref:S-type pyocin domain-containing protein n=1 Tax=Pseudomonas knackmussii TaxID=65741 RepID=UPI003BDA0FB6